MKVSDLIETLQKYPGNMDIGVALSPDDWVDIERVQPESTDGTAGWGDVVTIILDY